MLTLYTGSACDVCAEDYGPQCMPHSIPCGHVLCMSCCSTIVEKTSSRLTPVCPFCRVQFTSDSIRLIRMDFTTSGWSTPRRLPPNPEANSVFTNELWARKTERLLMAEGASKTRLEARRLEHKVAKVAAKKCSVEEVSTLHKELEEWLTSEVKQEEQSAALHLSAALLRAILVNHLAHSEASKIAKTNEANMRAKIDDMELTNSKLEAELRGQRGLVTQKTQECQTLRTELSRLRVVATTLGAAPNSSTPTPPSSPPLSSYNPTTQSPLARFHSTHVRSTSMSSRPSTPASPTRSYTPSPSIRSHTPTPSIRSHTPGPMRLPTPGPTQLRSQTPAPPPIPPKSRRLSHPSPPKMMRSTSDEKNHERWIPPVDPDSYGPHSGKPAKFAPRPPSRTASYNIASLVGARFRDARSPSPS